ncbi:MAG: hypothetical protein KAT76_04905 [Bacteroidales bacterium]|nr:hypothetical protein [Bacteroidales bacterium]
MHAQRNNPLRIELNANLDMENYNLTPCGENGVLVFFESEKKGSEIDTHVWHFAFYDKNFNQQWLADTALISGAKFKGFSSDEESTYLLFHDVKRQRSEYNLQILKVDYALSTFSVINGLAPGKSEAVYFGIHDGNAVIAFNNTSYEPNITIIDLSDGSSKKVKPELEGLNIIQELSFDQDGEHMLAIIENYLGKKQNAILILQLDLNGKIAKTYRINPAIDGKVINAARIAYSGGDTLLILGTYSNYASKVGESKNESGLESAGYFVTKFDGDKEVFINYYNFLEFKEMYRALSSKTVANLRKKAEKQKSKGEEYSLDYTLLLHDVIPFMGNYVLLSEAYYPEYRTVTNMYYDYYGRPIPQTYTVFDGYKYISGIAAAFSPDGQLVWDDGIEVRDILTFKLAKYLESHTSRGELAFFYSSENRLYYKIAGSLGSGSSLQNISIESKYKGDKVMEDLDSKMIHWYQNYFICYGYQKIKNNRISGGKRTVFYISKLAFN